MKKKLFTLYLAKEAKWEAQIKKWKEKSQNEGELNKYGIDLST